jgi:hypothetical protein
VLLPPAPADPEIAGARFAEHLKRYEQSGRSDELGITFTRLDALCVIAHLPAVRADGTSDPYLVKLGAEYYDAWPPTTAFVKAGNYEEAGPTSKWSPSFRAVPPWFQLHHDYQFVDGHRGQLVCFTFTAQYYMSPHSPGDDQVWQQGRHTLAATLSRLSDVLRPPYYLQPASG